MSTIVSFKHRWKNGIVSQTDLVVLWKGEPQEPLIALLERFEVAYKLNTTPIIASSSSSFMASNSSETKALMIPSLLPESPDISQHRIWPTYPPEGTYVVSISWLTLMQAKYK
jgi:hypothetical protein